MQLGARPRQILVVEELAERQWPLDFAARVNLQPKGARGLLDLARLRQLGFDHGEGVARCPFAALAALGALDSLPRELNQSARSIIRNARSVTERTPLICLP
jgi:hypothetical protein